MKRTTDIILATLGLAVLSPLLVVVIVLVLVSMGRPVFFRQLRPGYQNRPFELIKFRTMKERRDESGNLLPDETRLTKVGKFLRATSLDELPELWNVVRGDMSLVGPRPLLMEYLELYSKEQLRRHELRPGITGWAQVNGRNRLSWKEKFELDVWYVDNQSFFLDMRILVMTIARVIQGRDISHEGHATMEKFDGS